VLADRGSQLFERLLIEARAGLAAVFTDGVDIYLADCLIYCAGADQRIKPAAKATPTVHRNRSSRTISSSASAA
jgi:hypothetical protein